MSERFPVEYKLVNGCMGDPAVYAFSPTWGESILFDLGSLETLSNRELLRVRHAFVTHCHIDHFIGFEKLLRVNVPHHRQIFVYGPAHMIKNVQAKLQGYCWNLLEKDQVRFTVTELHPGGVIHRADLFSGNGFVATKPTISHESELVTFSDGAKVFGAVLDHGTDCIAYKYVANRRYHVLSEKLTREAVTPGSWIRDVQSAMTERDPERSVTLNGKVYKAQDLAQRFMQEIPPFSMGYLTDVVFSTGNLQRLQSLFSDVRLLVCEASFRDGDWPRSFAKKHLTTRQAALIAAWVAAKNLEIFHISGIYGEDVTTSQQEAATFFEAFRKLEPDELQQHIAAELARPTSA